MVSQLDFIRFALSFVRLGTFLVIIPLFNMRNIPIMAKIGLAALSALVIMPPIDSQLNVESLGVLALLALEEVAVGFLLGFVVILVFAIVTFAGHYVDTPIGFGMASVFDPAQGTQIPVFSQFYTILASLLFLGLDAHLWLLQGLQQSFRLLPFGTVINFEPSFWLLMDLMAELFVIGIKIALPMMATILLTDIGLGIIIRAVPQINVFVLGFPIKIMVGLSIVLITLPAFVFIATKLFAMDGLLFQYFQGLLAIGGS